MLALVGSGMAKFAAYETTGQSIIELMKQFPKTIQIIFGLNGFDLTKASGFYGVLFMYIALMLTIHAVLLGSEIIAEEERDKTTEFLFVRPITRYAAITAKLLAGLTSLIILNLVTLASSIYFVSHFGHGELFAQTLLILTTGLFMLQLIFFSIGAAVAGTIRPAKSASGIATSILMLTFFLMFLINFSDKLNNLKYLTPFKYFEALAIMTSGKLDGLYVALSGLIIIVAVVITYRAYAQRDLNT